MDFIATNLLLTLIPQISMDFAIYFLINSIHPNTTPSQRNEENELPLFKSKNFAKTSVTLLFCLSSVSVKLAIKHRRFYKNLNF
jgi:hypothetical protein